METPITWERPITVKTIPFNGNAITLNGNAGVWKHPWREAPYINSHPQAQWPSPTWTNAVPQELAKSSSDNAMSTPHSTQVSCVRWSHRKQDQKSRNLAGTAQDRIPIRPLFWILPFCMHMQWQPWTVKSFCDRTWKFQLRTICSDSWGAQLCQQCAKRTTDSSC